MKLYSISPECAFLPTFVENITSLFEVENHLKDAIFLAPTKGSKMDFQKLCVQSYGISPKTFVINEAIEDETPPHFIFCQVFKFLYEALEQTPLVELRTSTQTLISLTKSFILSLNEVMAHQVEITPQAFSGENGLDKCYFDLFCRLYDKMMELKREHPYLLPVEKRIQRLEKLKRYFSTIHHRPIVILGLVATKPYVRRLLESLTGDNVHMVLSGSPMHPTYAGHPFYLQQKLMEHLKEPKLQFIKGLKRSKTVLLEAPTFEQEAAQIAVLLEQCARGGKSAAFITQNPLLRALVEEELSKFQIIPGKQHVLNFGRTVTGQFLYLSATVLFSQASLHNTFAFLKNSLSRVDIKDVCEAEIYLRKQGFPLSVLITQGEIHKFPIIEALLNQSLKDQSFRPARVYGELLRAFLLPYLGEDLQFEDIWKALDHLPSFSPEGFICIFKSFLSHLLPLITISESPDIHFWTPLEARLRVADVIILGDLNEDSWPSSSRNPWLSEKTKVLFNIPTALEYQGLSFLDFLQLSNASTQCILTRSLLKDGKAQTPSRFLYEGEAYVKMEPIPEQQDTDVLHLSYVRTAPSGSKPLNLHQTDVRLLIQNPYAFYIKKILALVSLPEFQETLAPRILGQMIHKLFECIVKNKSFEDTSYFSIFKELTPYQKDQFSALVTSFKGSILELKEEGWTCWSEHKKSTSFGRLEVSARMDLVLEKHEQVRIVDYKTSLPPSLKSVLDYDQPQLALEALCYASQEVVSLEYWHTSLATAKIKEIKLVPEEAWLEKTHLFFAELFQDYLKENYLFTKTEEVLGRDEQHFMKIEF